MQALFRRFNKACDVRSSHQNIVTSRDVFNLAFDSPIAIRLCKVRAARRRGGAIELNANTKVGAALRHFGDLEKCAGGGGGCLGWVAFGWYTCWRPLPRRYTIEVVAIIRVVSVRWVCIWFNRETPNKPNDVNSFSVSHRFVQSAPHLPAPAARSKDLMPDCQAQTPGSCSVAQSE